MIEPESSTESKPDLKGPITTWMRVAEETRVRLTGAGGKDEALERLREIKSARRWFGRALAGLGGLMQAGGELDPRDQESVGALIVEFSQVIHQLQDLDERLVRQLQTGAETETMLRPEPSYNGELW